MNRRTTYIYFFYRELTEESHLLLYLCVKEVPGRYHRLPYILTYLKIPPNQVPLTKWCNFQMWMTVCMHTYVEDCDQTCDLGKLFDWKIAVNLHRKEHYVNQYQIRTGKTSLYSEKRIFWGYFYSLEHWNLVEFELTEQTWSCWETVKGRKCTISAEMNEEKKRNKERLFQKLQYDFWEIHWNKCSNNL